MIKHCPGCIPHAYQDATYGKNMRVMNPCKPIGSAVGAKEGGAARCTVCLTVHPVKTPAAPNPEKA